MTDDVVHDSNFRTGDDGHSSEEDEKAKEKEEGTYGIIPGLDADIGSFILTFCGIISLAAFLYCLVRMRRCLIARHKAAKERVRPASIPTCRYKQTRQFAEASAHEGRAECEEACSICLTTFEPEARVKELLCGHCFCAECLDQWLPLKGICPLCKRKARPRRRTQHRRKKKQQRREPASKPSLPPPPPHEAASGGSEGTLSERVHAAALAEVAAEMASSAASAPVSPPLVPSRGSDDGASGSSNLDDIMDEYGGGQILETY